MVMEVCGRPVTCVAELIHALFDSARDFYLDGGYEMLMNLCQDTQLYAFLSAQGYEEIVRRHCAEEAGHDEKARFTDMLSLLEVIAGIRSPEAALVRDFYMRFGPVGILTYTQALVQDSRKPAYRALSKIGTEYLDEIAGFHPAQADTIAALQRAYAPLGVCIQKMRMVLEDNPYSILDGSYDDGDILCTNLKGCFGFWIFGCSAPLGFQSWILSEGGVHA